MKKLIHILKTMDDMNWLIAELEAVGDEDIETIEDLADYLKEELQLGSY